MNSVDDLLIKLEKVKSTKTDHWTALCPAHNDRTPSLSVTLLPDKILVNCQAGCHINSVLSSLELKVGDLFLNSDKKKRSTSTKKKEIDKTYDYHDENDKLLFQVVRFKPKSFSQRRPVGKDKWEWDLKGVTPVIYHLPKVIEAINIGRTIFITEGEKDADNMINMLQVVATTGPMGAGKWRESYTQSFKNAKQVVVIADNDAPGRKHAVTIANELLTINVPTKLLEMSDEAKDITDLISSGLTVEQLKQSVDSLPPYYVTIAVDTDEATPFNLTDYGNAERLVNLHGDVIRYSPERKSWLIWTGKRWEWDLGNIRIAQLAKKTARGIYREASDTNDDDYRKDIVKHAIASERQVRIDAMIKSAESETNVAISISNLDANNWLLNVHNGTVDLNTGKLKEHNKNDLITEILTVNYEQDATNEEWSVFLQQIFSEKEDLINYVQRALGYSITGDQSEQAFFFCYGSGFNGKSTLLNACRLVMEQYATQVPPTAFMVDKNKRSGPDEAIANLRNKRLVCSTELEDGQRLSVSLVKRMTGGEPLWHEQKFEKGFNFQPTHKLWLSGNHEPVITDTTNSIWFRLKKIPFIVEIPEEKREKGYGEYLAREHASVILAWLVRGCVEWRKLGHLGEPEVVKQAVVEYREQQDILHDYLVDRCILERNAAIITKELWDNYKDWCSDNDSFQLKQRAFYNRIREKGVQNERGTSNKPMFRGIRIRQQNEEVTKVTKITDFQQSLLHEAPTRETLQETSTESNLGNESTTEEMPNCPDCQKNEWEFSVKGLLKCPCGFEETEENRIQKIDNN